MKKTNNIENLTDNEIIILYKKSKDKNLVGELYKRYTKFVFLISMKYLTDEDASKDAVMQIFEKLFEDLIKHEITNFKSWLHTVTRNHCFLILRTENYIQKKEEEIKKDSSKLACWQMMLQIKQMKWNKKLRFKNFKLLLMN